MAKKKTHYIIWDSYAGGGEEMRQNANVRCACGAMGRRVEIERRFGW